VPVDNDGGVGESEQNNGGRLLSGVTVLDFTNVLSGPFATYQMSLFGAEVIKVERPRVGDLARKLGANRGMNEAGLGASFLAQNCGKKSITVDLKDARGVAVIKRLVEEVDVVVENFRPGVMSRLGLGWEELREVNGSLIYCSVSGYGQSGPLRESAAYDQIIQGQSGMMSVTGDASTGPLRAGFPIADTLGGMAAAFAVASALYRRSQSGVGTYLDVSMLESAMTAMGWVMSNHLTTGEEPAPMGNDNFTASPSGTFQTADGAINIAANEDRQFKQLCIELGLESLSEDERYKTRQARLVNRAELSKVLTTKLTEHDSSYWVRELSAAGVPAGQVATISEALHSRQIDDRKFVHEVSTTNSVPGMTTARVLGSPIVVDGTRNGPQGPAPTIGQDTEDVLAFIGYTNESIDELKVNKVI
jgi:crotonobetainyl-CoA:carnitine CoA-transferase CaiB-like acyl-CoA transferase